MPSSMHPHTTSMSTASPRSCPAVRLSPRSWAHRPLPSITSATWRGTTSVASSGGRAPEGCGSGGRTVRSTRGGGRRRGNTGPILPHPGDVPVHQRERAQRPLGVPLQVGGHQSTGLGAGGLGGPVGRRPATLQQGEQQGDNTWARGDRAGGAAVHAHHTARADVETGVRPGRRAARALGQRRGRSPRTPWLAGGTPSAPAADPAHRRPAPAARPRSTGTAAARGRAPPPPAWPPSPAPHTPWCSGDSGRRSGSRTRPASAPG